jgi:hypothetical protein
MAYDDNTNDDQLTQDVEDREELQQDSSQEEKQENI